MGDYRPMAARQHVVCLLRLHKSCSIRSRPSLFQPQSHCSSLTCKCTSLKTAFPKISLLLLLLLFVLLWLSPSSRSSKLYVQSEGHEWNIGHIRLTLQPTVTCAQTRFSHLPGHDKVMLLDENLCLLEQPRSFRRICRTMTWTGILRLNFHLFPELVRSPQEVQAAVAAEAGRGHGSQSGGEDATRQRSHGGFGHSVQGYFVVC